MAKPLLPDELWERIEPLLPPPKPRRFRFPGRKPLDNRKALTGILFVLKTGIPWEYLPLEMGCGSGMTCWRRLRDWQAAGVWQQLHEILLAELNAADKIDWSARSSTLRSCGPWAVANRPAPVLWTGGKGEQASCPDRWAGRAVGRGDDRRQRE